ncbi:peptide-methionine (S)-S-oxide reductase [Caulobacter sp. D4A]|uniref:peptide-methionine (S)-S-oxide reductase MsrA n=1 Tax=unclassified Caulobacter TaxID=2648921 RepID=UPI000D736237|nr:MULTISPECIES: peptide-methionine (S)-S-oxide reductase MsrA [unclassified Caulobacter]PXA93635.1 peptide-methionine (S)-S-oxide reductase [Caulobacter sp. D5]PXA94727.1 peptide-methionine (S)-S-oxide reductase [Caulobacter sp. D4A]
MLRRLLLLIALATALPVAALAAPTRTAVFAGGCFWCMENDMRGIPGVVKVESGYTGGHVKNPTYRDVTSERSGHYEAVRVTYDPAKLPYAFLLQRYWKLVDPTDDEGQFCDRGPSYRPAVFVDAEQRPAAERSRAEAAKRLKTGTMKAQILPLQTFWPAEAYHRDYAKNNSVEYHLYRTGCGRDRRLAQVWGK